MKSASFITGTFVFAAMFAAMFALPQTVSAQVSPPISPWMGMFQSSRGNPFGNYQTYVKPQMDMMSEFKAQGSAIQKQAAQGKQLEGSMDKVLETPRKHPAIGGQAGCGFGQHSHYYQNMGASPVPNFSTPRVGGKVR